VLNELHCLPMAQRVWFKLALIVFKCLHGVAPSYLADDCVLVLSVAGNSHATWDHTVLPATGRGDIPALTPATLVLDLVRDARLS